MKRLGNEIPWYKPFKLARRNKELETLTETQFCYANDLQENISVLRESLLKIKHMCEESNTKLSKKILEEIKID